MYSYGNSSNKVLETIEHDLRNTLVDAIRVSPWDFSLITGRRGKCSQMQKFREGFSQTPWPFSNHNSFKVNGVIPEYGEERNQLLQLIKDKQVEAVEHNGLVHAFDIIPYPEKWSNKELIASLSRWMQGFFASRNIIIRLGTDWNNDGIWTEEKFFDGGHCERLIT